MKADSKGSDAKDEIFFADDNDVPLSGQSTVANCCSEGISTALSETPHWKILVVDDDEDVYTYTRLLLKNFTFEGWPLCFIQAHSATQARELLVENPDIAIVFLDVVMEHEHAGLDLVRIIRNELGNRYVRIILRTGQPGQAPEIDVMANCDINDYLEKGSLTFVRLYSSLTSALRTYRDLMNLEQMHKEVQQTSEALAHSIESLIEAQAIAQTGSWRWNYHSGILQWSDETFHILGLDPKSTEPHWQTLYNTIHPEDRKRFWSGSPNKRNLSTEPPVSEYRFFRADGQQRLAKESKRILRDEQGNQTAVVGTLRDVTEKRQREARDLRSFQSRITINALLETSLAPLSMERQLQVALDIILTLPWLAILRKGTIFLYDEFNDILQLIASCNMSEALELSCARVPVGTCLCGLAAQKREIVYSNCMDHRHTVRYEGISEHGHYCVPILSQDKLMGVLNLYLDPNHQKDSEEEAFMTTVSYTLAGIIERRKMEERLAQAENQLKQLAHHDTLTGLPNRLLFMELLRQNLAHMRRSKEKLALMFLDLDRFKAVNDQHGHDTGDELLKQAARRIVDSLREQDAVARIGGDEFVAILPDVENEETVGSAAQRILENLKSPFLALGHQCQIGVSIGVTLYPNYGNDAETLIKQADRAMYAVKNSGRNGYQLYNPNMEPNPKKEIGIKG